MKKYVFDFFKPFYLFIWGGGERWGDQGRQRENRLLAEPGAQRGAQPQDPEIMT